MVPAVLVRGRYYGRTLTFLNMYNNADELADPADREDGRADAYWLVESARFVGSAHPLLDEHSVGDDLRSVDLPGTVSVAETDTHHYLLFTSYGAAGPAIWIRAPRGALDIQDGPTGLSISSTDWRLDLRGVAGFHPRSRLGTPGQEGALLASLRRAGPPVAAAPLPRTTRTRRVEWLPGSPSGLFVEREDGEATGRTALSSPLADQGVRLAQALEAHWLPPNVLARQYRLTIADQDSPALSRRPAPGRSWTSLANTPVALSTGRSESDETRGYLWPVVAPDGRPMLNADETSLGSWSTVDPKAEVVDAEGNDDLPYRLMPSKSQAVDCTVTNRRLVIVGSLSAGDMSDLRTERSESRLLVGKVPQGLLDTDEWARLRDVLESELAQVQSPFHWTTHIRWEWVSGIARYTEQLQREQRSSGLFGKKTLVTTSVAWLQLDVLLPDGSARRYHVDEARNDDVPALGDRLSLLLQAVAQAGVGEVATEPTVTGRPLMHGQAWTERWAVTGTPGHSIPAPQVSEEAVR
jgi:hypothetical protein